MIVTFIGAVEGWNAIPQKNRTGSTLHPKQMWCGEKSDLRRIG